MCVKFIVVSTNITKYLLFHYNVRRDTILVAEKLLTFTSSDYLRVDMEISKITNLVYIFFFESQQKVAEKTFRQLHDNSFRIIYKDWYLPQT